ncbi:MAG: DUF1993 domain-containing protein [Sphingobium sp.]|nr:DUF1993 domain-containing protein [Sphingobium sp.]
MSDDLAQRAAKIFRTRLQSLSDWMGKAEARLSATEGGITGLMAARMAPDMYPFPYQIVFACNQAHEFIAWCRGESYSQPDPTALHWLALKDHVAQTMTALDEAVAAGVAALPDKHIDLMGQAHLDLSGRRYVDDWLLPNFYFHLVIAYALMRNHGVDVGKVDYMAHLAGDVRPNG